MKLSPAKFHPTGLVLFLITQSPNPCRLPYRGVFSPFQSTILPSDP